MFKLIVILFYLIGLLSIAMGFPVDIFANGKVYHVSLFASWFGLNQEPFDFALIAGLFIIGFTTWLILPTKKPIKEEKNV